MIKNKEHWTKSAWTISIGTAIFSLLLTIGYDYLKAKPVLTTIWAIIKYIANLFWTILNFDLKVWWIIVTVLLFILGVVLIDKFYKKEDISKPDFYSYREGRFKKWRWTWGWNWNIGKNAWIITDMKAHCPKCDTSMIDYSNRYELRFDCPRCDFKASNYECDEPHKIERIIIDNIERQRVK